MIAIMFYVSRKEKHSPRSKSSGQAGTTKFVMMAALILTAVSLVLTALAAALIVSQRTPVPASAEVVPAKQAPVNEPAEAQAPAEEQDAAVVTGAKPGSAETSPEATHTAVKQTPNQKQPQKVIYLTFDDGPGKYTEQILDILERYHIHGTFFMIGNQVSGYKQAVKDTATAGHYVGLHSMSHSKKKLYDSEDSDQFIKEFTQEQKLIKKIIGTAPTLIRAPYGSKPEIGETFRGDIAAAGFKMWDWTVDSKDWKHADKPELILQEVKRQTHRDTEVILLHEKAQTVEMLPQVIEYLQKKGYAFAVYKPNQHFSVNFDNDPRL